MDYTVIVQGRHQFGNRNLNIGVFVGREETWRFNCPNVDASQTALLLFQGQLVSSQHSIKINGVDVPGGIPTGPITATSTFSNLLRPPEIHSHSLYVGTFGWTSYVMLVVPRVLQASGNAMTVIFQDPGDGTLISPDPEFIIDNVVLLYKT